MKIGLIVNNAREAPRLVDWAIFLGAKKHADLHVIVVQEKQGEREWGRFDLPATPPPTEDQAAQLAQPTVACDAGSDGKPSSTAAATSEARPSDSKPSDSKSGDSQLEAAVRRLGGLDPSGDSVLEPAEKPKVEYTGEFISWRLRDPNPGRALESILPTLGVDLLILCIDELALDAEIRWKAHVYRTSNCETMVLRSNGGRPESTQRILVPTGSGANPAVALSRARKVATLNGTEIVAAYVQDPTGELSAEIGLRTLDRNVRDAVGKSAAASVEKHVVVAGNVLEGISKVISSASSPFDLMMVGAFREPTLRKLLLGRWTPEAEGENSPMAMVAVRGGLPIGTRFQQFCERQIQQVVPQLNRDSRIDLFERIQTASHWNFDFMALICLSTCLAALGLVRNQASVVIGAMLVAPLMTPLVGTGLALVQGNGALIRSALWTVLLGFLSAFVVALMVGLMVPLGRGGLTTEMLARTSPRFPDLLVALVGGIAAAYAMSRAHLLSALPGVAIAAALVPPIATSAIMLAHGRVAYACGALVLFATNIVAITLGTAISLRLVGIRDAHDHSTSQRWTRRYAAILLAVTIVLGYVISHRAPRIGKAAMDTLQTRIEAATDQSGLGIVDVIVTMRGDHVVWITLDAPTDELGNLPEKLHNVVRAHFANEAVRVKLQIRHVLVMNPLPDDAKDPSGATENPPAR